MQIDEKIIKEIEKHTNLPIYSTTKMMDDTNEFIVYRYSVSESAWSNDKVDAYVIDVSLLISQQRIQDLIQTMTNIYQNTAFELVATGINAETFNHEAIMYGAFEVSIDEI